MSIFIDLDHSLSVFINLFSWNREKKEENNEQEEIKANRHWHYE